MFKGLLALIGVALCTDLSRAPIPFFDQFSTRSELDAVLFNSKDGISNQNTFLGVYSDKCKDTLNSSLLFTAAHRIVGPQYLHIATIPVDEVPELKKKIDKSCPAIFFFPKGGSLATSKKAAQTTPKELSAWMSTMTRVTLKIRNNLKEPFNYYWVNEGHDETYSGTIAAGTTSDVSSHLGHSFLIRNSTSHQVIDYFIADAEGSITSIPSSRACPTCTQDEIITQMSDFFLEIWHSKRLGLNDYQPRLIEQITRTGYEKHQMPHRTYQRLLNWYRENQPKHEAIETLVGPCINQEETPTFITHVGSKEKNMLHRDMQPLLEGWSRRKLELTSIYGIRRYTRGSILRMHVDTVTSHAVSAIINISQNSSSPWMLSIMDHEFHQHEVPMNAGDIIYYESARLLHGRPVAFDGEDYSNIFIHYRPVQGWDYSWV